MKITITREIHMNKPINITSNNFKLNITKFKKLRNNINNKHNIKRKT